MKRYEITARGKLTVTLLSLVALICVAAVISTQFSQSPAVSPSASPGKETGGNLAYPANSPSDASSGPSGAGSSDRTTPPSSLEPIPVTTPTPQEKPTPSLSWGSKSLVVDFDRGSSELNSEALSAISQFLGDSPDLTGWIMVVEGFSKQDEASVSLRAERANAVGDYIIERYGISPDMILPINGSSDAESSYAEIKFISSGSK